MLFLKVLSAPPASSRQSENTNLSLEQPILSAKRHNEIFYIIPFLLLVIGLKIALALFIWRHGFLEYDADGFTRSVRAWDWHTGATKLEVDAWLPLQFWLNGWLMGIWPNLLYVPRVVNMLCSVGTTISFFFIGRSLFGRLNGYATALLAAIFPWEIWLGMSGMSESIANFCLSFGMLFFCRWLKSEPGQFRWLVIASFGFLGATMVRYEAWFYSAIYAVIVLYFIWQYRANLSIKTRLKLIASLAPAFVFIAIWMYLSWIDPRLHSPLGFASLTSGVNAKVYGSENASASFLYRLFFYPQTFFTLLYQLTVPAIAGSLWLLFRPVKAARPYLFLVWGEFALFILTTLPYNNIAPGSARYPVSNLLLLLPVIVYLFQLLFQRPQLVLRLASAGVFLVLAGSLIYTVVSRSTSFPDGSTRQVADLLNQRWSEGYIKPDEKVFLILPPADGPQANDYTRAYYALKVLTNHPDSFVVEANPAKFTEALTRQNGTAPHIWVRLDSAGGSSTELDAGYMEIKTFGDYTVGDYPLYGQVTATVVPSSSGQTFHFTVNEYRHNETTSVWVTRPDGKVITLGNRPADANGVVSFDYTVDPADVLAGQWSVAVTGMETGRRSSTAFEVSSVSN